jgi:pyridoxal phosphate enzyme (YggS family)
MLLKNDQGAYTGAPLHFIGRLQSNKVRNVVGLCDLIESVDSVSLIEQIDKKANLIGIKQDILIEVNIGREGSKSGILPENLESLTDRAEQSPGVRVRGLMAIPPLDADLSQTRHYFDEMFKLFVDIRAKKYDNISMNFLSMGMSDSYIEAIGAGANMVRVGSAIFGDRQY